MLTSPIKFSKDMGPIEANTAMVLIMDIRLRDTGGLLISFGRQATLIGRVVVPTNLFISKPIGGMCPCFTKAALNFCVRNLPFRFHYKAASGTMEFMWVGVEDINLDSRLLPTRDTLHTIYLNMPHAMVCG